MDHGRVRELIKVMLRSQEFEGRAELLRQADDVGASGSATSLKLSVASEVPRSQATNNPVAVMWAWDSDGRPIGCMSLWTADGYLSSLDNGWVTDDKPTSLPDPALLR